MKTERNEMERKKENEVKNMKTKANEMEEEDMYEQISIEDCKKADWWYPRIQANPKKLKELKEKAKKDEQYQKILFVIEEGLTIEDILANKRATSSQQEPAKTNATTYVSLIDKISKKAKAEIFSGIEDPLNDILAERQQRIYEKQNEGKVTQNVPAPNKKETNKIKEERRKQKQEIDQKAKELLIKRKQEEAIQKQKTEEARQENIIQQTYQRLTQLAGIKSNVEKDVFGHPIVTVKYNKQRATLNGLMVRTPGIHNAFMYEKVWAPSMRRAVEVPMKITDRQGELVFAEPCIDKINEKIEQEMKQRREELEKNAIEVPVITFDNKVYAIVDNMETEVHLDKWFRVKVLQEQSEMQGIWKVAKLPARDGKGDSVFLKVLGEKPLKKYSRREVEKKRIEKFGVHAKTFVCKTLADGDKTIFLIVPDKNDLEETASYEVDTGRMLVIKDNMMKIREKGENKAWRMEYRWLYNLPSDWPARNTEENNKRRKFRVDPVEYLGDANEYINKMYGD